ncbi:MAG: hypothetical protein AAB131_07390 [Actinomycetota bacterium]|jgi:hypothetical protein
MSFALLLADLLTVLLTVGAIALVVCSTIMIIEYLPASRSQGSTEQRKPPSGVAQAVAEARARASAASVVLGLGAPVSGQIIDLADDWFPDRQKSVDDAHAIASHFAETDPQRVAEVITQWIRADWTDLDDAH